MSLQQLVVPIQQQQQQFSRQDVEVAVKQAIARREEELRIFVMQMEEEVEAAIAEREEILEAVRNGEAEVDAACVQREELIKKVDKWIQWVLARVEGRGNTAGGSKERAGGECEEAAAARYRYSDDDSGERFVKPCYSRFRLYS